MSQRIANLLVAIVGVIYHFTSTLTIANINDPALIICSEATALPAGAHTYAKRTKAPVTELRLENVNQFDFYDRKDVVEQSTNAIAEFFKK